ncbi:MAG TPA: chromate transporter [Erysipelothrix sp.]|nr:chromate transporter [Erysipelothrix sp.]
MVYKDLARLFLRLGFFAYGGPAAHISMMRDEVVDRKGWYTDEEFLDMIGFTNLIPGPNSTELAILIGYKQGGLIGLLISGLCFIIPAVVIVLIFTAFYMKYQSLPQVQSILKGMIPAIFLIVMGAVIKLGQKTIKDYESMLLVLVGVILIFFNVSEVWVLFLGPLYFLLKRVLTSTKNLAVEPFSLVILFMTFLKIGSILYGSGYVLISFLQTEFVEKLSWLTSTQLIELVAIGEITPGPVFTTATAVGYFLGGGLGSLLATLGIFIPSFLLISILYPLYERIKTITWTQAFLKGINLASMAMLASVGLKLGLGSLDNITTITLTSIAFVLFSFFKLKPTHLILLGAVLGYIVY